MSAPTSSDRELLELAAKAVGYDTTHPANAKRLTFTPPIDALWIRNISMGWNPLEGDGDALRLAVKLHIDIRHFMYEDGCMDCLVDRLGRGFQEKFTDDHAAATRRAIVRAAAEIGKAIP